MKNIRLNTFVIVILFLLTSCRTSQVLFQQGNTNWEQKGNATWQFLSNELIGTANKQAGYIITKQTYNNFILELEFNPNSTINSGIFIRCKDYKISTTDCYEANIWDLHKNPDFKTGSIIHKSAPLQTVKTNNKWNTYKIKAENDHIQVWVNNTLTADIKDNTCTDGYIGIQAKGTGEIKLRNVKIKAL